MLRTHDTREITGALADPTRYGIYQAVVEAAGEALSVADVAARFSLHPNVARMHLQRLVEVGLATSDTRRTPGGGRPARIYRLSDRVATLQFPPRDYEALASLALQIVETLGGADPAALEKVGRDMGRDEGQRALTRDRLDPATADLAALKESFERTCIALGLSPRITQEGDTLRVEVRNCVFRELSAQHPGLVCSLHTAILRGVLEAYFGDFQLDADPSIFAGGAACLFSATLCAPTPRQRA